jgi:hypothetical protein
MNTKTRAITRGPQGESMTWLYYQHNGNNGGTKHEQLIGSWPASDPRSRDDLERLALVGLNLPLEGCVLGWTDDSDEPVCPLCGAKLRACSTEEGCWHCDEDSCLWCGPVDREDGQPFE